MKENLIETEVLIEDVRESELGIDNENWSPALVDFGDVIATYATRTSENGDRAVVVFASGHSLVLNMTLRESATLLKQSR